MTKQELCSSVIDSLNSYNRRMYQYGKSFRTYGTAQLLRVDQIQLINLIGNYEGINLRSLAELAVISVPTLSLQVNRLVKLNLIKKERAPNSQREIVIHLTQEGAQAYRFHQNLDDTYFSNVARGLCKYTEEELAVIYDFIHNLESKDLMI